MSATQNFEDWLKKVQAAASGEAIFKLLADFRKLDWTDEERARMSKVYMRALQRSGAATASSAKAMDEDDGPDGPVWYEKM
jgi:hypothetical protein